MTHEHENTHAALEIGLTPTGTLFILPTTSDSDGTWQPPADAAAAFINTQPESILITLASGRFAPLPPAWGFWRDFALRYINALCHLPENEADQGTVPPPTDDAWRDAVLAAPPMPGGEYLSPAVLTYLWNALGLRIAAEIAGHRDGVSGWLQEHNPQWRTVGKVCFHLAENKNDPDYPFAFLATYAVGLSAKGTVRHAPLGSALKQYAGAKDKPALLKLLEPVHKASERSRIGRELVESGRVFHPLAWTAEDAYAFLKDIPALEEAGLAVRVPDWWTRRPRPVATASIGKSKTGGVGRDAILSFDIAVSLNGETLTPDEIDAILSGADGLRLVKGQWVEVDRDKLREALAHWRKVARDVEGDGLSLQRAMRLLAGGDELLRGGNAETAEATREWSRATADGWFRETLERLRHPEQDPLRSPPPAGLNATLRPYQDTGVRWLSFLSELGLGACLADDMGLGKTLQIIALLLRDREATRREGGTPRPSLIVLPASLLANWRAELDRFAPTLKAVYLHPAFTAPGAIKEIVDNPEERLQGADCVFTSYALAVRYAWLSGVAWRFVILDEAQAIKNPAAKQSRRVKEFRADARVALTGTPVENRLTDLWSLFDFLNPGLLGGAKSFTRFANRLAEREHDKYRPLRLLTSPYILRRLKTDPAISASLPEKTEVKAWCGLSKRQAVLYKESVGELASHLAGVDGVKRQGVILAFLMRFKQICNHPDQWLGQQEYNPADSGKFSRLREIAEEIASRRERCLVFTQFREMTVPLAEFLAGVFGRAGLVLHGEIPVKQRKPLIDAFQTDNGPPFMVLSLKAGGVGLNLTAASQVVHFDRWWNPAVENQATDRAFRIGQTKNVLVHKFVARGTIEERIDALIEEKQELSRDVLEGGAIKALTEMTNDELLRFVALDLKTASAD